VPQKIILALTAENMTGVTPSAIYQSASDRMNPRRDGRKPADAMVKVAFTMLRLNQSHGSSRCARLKLLIIFILTALAIP
jgi:hypothetical protein